MFDHYRYLRKLQQKADRIRLYQMQQKNPGLQILCDFMTIFSALFLNITFNRVKLFGSSSSISAEAGRTILSMLLVSLFIKYELDFCFQKMVQVKDSLCGSEKTTGLSRTY